MGIFPARLLLLVGGTARCMYMTGRITVHLTATPPLLPQTSLPTLPSVRQGNCGAAAWSWHTLSWTSLALRTNKSSNLETGWERRHADRKQIHSRHAHARHTVGSSSWLVYLLQRNAAFHKNLRLTLLVVVFKVCVWKHCKWTCLKVQCADFLMQPALQCIWYLCQDRRFGSLKCWSQEKASIF